MNMNPTTTLLLTLLIALGAHLDRASAAPLSPQLPQGGTHPADAPSQADRAQAGLPEQPEGGRATGGRATGGRATAQPPAARGAQPQGESRIRVLQQRKPQSALEKLDREMRRAVRSIVGSVVRIDKLGPLDEAPAGSASADAKSRRLERRIPEHYTGFVLDVHGHIVTVPEAVTGAERIYVKTLDGREFPATIVGSEENAGVAVIKAPLVRLTPAQTAPTARIDVGALAIAVGSPYGLTTSPALGMISGIRKMRLGAGKEVPMLQLSLAVNPGDYGGPIADASGRIVGMVVSSFRVRDEEEADDASLTLSALLRHMNAAKRDTPDRSTEDLFFEWLEGHAENPQAPSPRFAVNNSVDENLPSNDIHFALPILPVLQAASQLIDQNRQPARIQRFDSSTLTGRPWMGVRVIPVQAAPIDPQRPEAVFTGLQISEVIQNGPAERAGIQPDDLIIGFNGAVVRSVEELQRALLGKSTGHTVHLDVVRDGKNIKVVMRLSPHPVVAETVDGAPPPPAAPAAIPPADSTQTDLPGEKTGPGGESDGGNGAVEKEKSQPGQPGYEESSDDHAPRDSQGGE